MEKIRYFMCPFVLTSKDKGRQDGRAILTVEGCLNISKIEKGIRKKTENLGAEVVFDTDSGYRLFEYIKENGQECFDVLLVDICMPVMNGLDVIAGVKKLKMC